MYINLKEKYDKGETTFLGYGVTHPALDEGVKFMQGPLPFMKISPESLFTMCGTPAIDESIDCRLKSTPDDVRSHVIIRVNVFGKYSKEKFNDLAIVGVNKYEDVYFVTEVYRFLTEDQDKADWVDLEEWYSKSGKVYLEISDEDKRIYPHLANLEEIDVKNLTDIKILDCIGPMCAFVENRGEEEDRRLKLPLRYIIDFMTQGVANILVYTGDHKFKHGEVFDPYDMGCIILPCSYLMHTRQFLKLLVDGRGKRDVFVCTLLMRGGYHKVVGVSYITYDTARFVASDNIKKHIIAARLEKLGVAAPEYKIQIVSSNGVPNTSVDEYLPEEESDIVYDILSSNIMVDMDIDEENKVTKIKWWIE